MLGSISINAGVSKCPARKAICSSVGCRGSSWSKKLLEAMLGASRVFLGLMEVFTDPSPCLSPPLVNRAAHIHLQPSPIPPNKAVIPLLWRDRLSHSLSCIIDTSTTANMLLMDFFFFFKCPTETQFQNIFAKYQVLNLHLERLSETEDYFCPSSPLLHTYHKGLLTP